MKLSKVIAVTLSLGMVMSSLSPVAAAAETKETKGGVTYYIDQDGGSDANSGTSKDRAWSSLEKVNSTTFQPGDKLLFQAGDIWTGQLSPKGSGEEGNPIVIGKYGDENKRPLIQGNNWCGDQGDNLEDRIFNAAVYFYNQQYWEITSLEVTNRIPGENPNDHIKKYGVLIMAQDAGVLKHMYCRDLDVHDIVSHPIGQQAGIGRGGIIYSIRGNKVPTSWDDIVVENNIVGPRINHYGINFMSTWGSSRFEHETGIPDAEYANKRVNSTNIVIRNNYCQDVGNAAICPTAYENVIIERNTSNGCNSGPNGNVPIWWENGKYTVAQFNEVFGSGASESKEDSQAFDADVSADLNYIQYNYTHDNPSGAYFECALGSKFTTHIRYNISQNDGYGNNSYGGGAVVTIGGYSTGDKNQLYVYNNDFYLDGNHNSWITNSWDGETVNPETYWFKNNVIYSDASSKGWHKSLMGTADHNAYGGSDSKVLRADDKNPVTVTKADFKAIGTGGSGLTPEAYKKGESGLNTVDGYKLAKNSKLIGAGTVIDGNGGRDYWGNPVSQTHAPNIGADNTNASIGADDRGIDFEDRPQEETPLTGNYQGCQFGEGWLTGNGVLYADGNKKTYSITLPDKKVLTSFRAFCEGSALVTVKGMGYEKTFGVNSAAVIYQTGFTSAMKEIEIEIQSPQGSGSINFDNIVLKDGEYEIRNLARNQPSWEDGDSQYDASYGNDGDDNSLWVHAGDEKGIGWMVDLGKDYDLENFELVFEQAESIPWKYSITAALSEESIFKTEIWDARDNKNGSRVNKGTFAEGTRARYLRVVIEDFPGDDYWPGFAEFKVYERTSQTETPDMTVLKKKIEEAKGYQQESYTEESYQKLQDAIDKAIEVSKTGKTQQEVEAMVSELEDAIQNLVEKARVNLALHKPASSDGPTQAPASNGNDGDSNTQWIVDGDQADPMLPQSWMVDLEKEYVLSDYQLEFEQDGGAGFWRYKIEGSKDKNEFVLLEEKQDSTEGIRTEKGSFSSNEAYRYVRVTLIGFPEYDGADYWPAFAEFSVYGTEYKEVDKTALNNKLLEVKAIEKGNYTDDSYQALQDAIKNAEAVLNKSEASQEEVDAQVVALTQAVSKLKEKEPAEPEEADKKLLTEQTAAAKGLNLDAYTKESVQVLEAAIQAAETVLKDENATQEQVEQASRNLMKAVEGLVKTQPTVTPTVKPTNTPTKTPTKAPTKAPSSGNTNTSSPKTGDETPIAACIFSMLMMGGLLTFCWKKRTENIK